MANDNNANNYKTTKEINVMLSECSSTAILTATTSLLSGCIAIPYMFKSLHMPIGNEIKLAVTGISIMVLSIIVGTQTKSICEKRLIKQILEEEIS